MWEAAALAEQVLSVLLVCYSAFILTPSVLCVPGCVLPGRIAEQSW